MNFKTLFADIMPPRVAIPTPIVEEIEQSWLKALEHKRKQAEDRVKRKVEKDARPKKKSKATEGGSLEPLETTGQERHSKPISNHPTELPPSLPHLVV